MPESQANTTKMTNLAGVLLKGGKNTCTKTNMSNLLAQTARKASRGASNSNTL
jgi:hypothetical protein